MSNALFERLQYTQKQCICFMQPALLTCEKKYVKIEIHLSNKYQRPEWNFAKKAKFHSIFIF